MTTRQQTQSVSNDATTGAVHLLMKGGEVKLVVEKPEQVMEEIRHRAEQVGSVLEHILSEAHAEPRWGINE